MFSDGKFCEATLELARAGAIKKKRERQRKTERDTTVVRVWWKKLALYMTEHVFL